MKIKIEEKSKMKNSRLERKPRSSWLAIMQMTFDEKGKMKSLTGGKIWISHKPSQRNSTSDKTNGCVSLWNDGKRIVDGRSPLFTALTPPSPSYSQKKESFYSRKTSSETTERKITSVVDTASSPRTASCSALHSVTWCLHVFNFSFICCFYISLPSTKRIIIIIILVTNSFHFISCASTMPMYRLSSEIISLRLIYSRPSRDVIIEC